MMITELMLVACIMFDFTGNSFSVYSFVWNDVLHISAKYGANTSLLPRLNVADFRNGSLLMHIFMLW